MNKIYNADVLDILPKIDSGSIDLVFTDPPYNVKKKYDGYDDSRDEYEYLDWMKYVIWHCSRISNHKIIFYVSGNLTEKFFQLLPDSHLIIVHKRAAGIAKNNYQQQYHSILSTANPIIKCRDVWDDIRLPGEGYYFREPRYDNPGLTSELLVEKILYHFTKEGDTVLDPFMGTGTTAESCIKMNRKYVGIEQSEKYCKMAQDRIDKLNK
jgi:site-specific DNA-methyltransferase (adenine-specific)